MTVTRRGSADKGGGPRPTREQLKAEKRMRIAAVAMELFSQRGFEGVSVAEVAATAGVTEKTVFNHFATKEDLVYARDQEFEDALLDRVRSRPRGETPLEGARTFFLETYGRGLPSKPGARRHAVTLAALVAESPALRTREREILHRYTERLADLLAAEYGSGPDDLRPVVVASALIAVHQAVIQGYRQGLLAREPVARLQRRMLAAASEAFGMLADGFAGLPTHDAQDPRD